MCNFDVLVSFKAIEPGMYNIITVKSRNCDLRKNLNLRKIVPTTDPILGGCMLMNSRGGPPFGGLYEF